MRQLHAPDLDRANIEHSAVRFAMPPGSLLRSTQCRWVTRSEREAGAAQVTLARYTHALPEDVERARAKLAAYRADTHKAAVAGQ